MSMLTALAALCAASLFAVWLGYPLVMAALARLCGRPVRAPLGEPPTVSIVLATRESDAAIRARVLDCLAASYEPSRLQVVVALDATRGPTSVDLGIDDPRVLVVRGDTPGGKAATLNAGVRASSGSVLVFTDTHQRFAPESVGELTTAFADPRTGAATGYFDLPGGDERLGTMAVYWRLERALRRAEASVHSSVGVTGAIWALRRELWSPLPAALILDDVYTPMRLVLDGHRIAFVSTARAWETRGAALLTEYRRKVRTLTGVIQLCAWLPAILVPWRNPIWFQFVFHKLLRLLTPYWVIGVALWVGAAALSWGGRQPAVVLGGVLSGALLAGMAFRDAARRLMHAIVAGVVLQGAVLRATYNGLRGRWDVW